MTFLAFAYVYKERYVIAKHLARRKDYDWAVKPFVEVRPAELSRA